MKESTPRFAPDDLSPIFKKLGERCWKCVLVGGQAINILVQYHGNKTDKLASLLPYTCEDLDFLGGPLEVAILNKALQGRCITNKNSDPSPNAAVKLTPFKGGMLRIDMLTFIDGVDSGEVE